MSRRIDEHIAVLRSTATEGPSKSIVQEDAQIIC